MVVHRVYSMCTRGACGRQATSRRLVLGACHVCASCVCMAHVRRTGVVYATLRYYIHPSARVAAGYAPLVSCSRQSWRQKRTTRPARTLHAWARHGHSLHRCARTVIDQPAFAPPFVHVDEAAAAGGSPACATNGVGGRCRVCISPPLAREIKIRGTRGHTVYHTWY